ncbi:hypothetical protein ACRZOU_000785 [Aeromonas salmonicida]
MANNHTYAPIVIFAFNRPEHFKKTVSTLAECELAKLSKVIVVVDGPRGEEDFSKQKVMLDYLQSVVAFLSIEVRIRKKNVGLEINISSGITDIMAEYGRAIILEDDILVSTHFLRFMNESLDFYQDKKEVWHISGWNFPLQEDNLPSCFLWRTALGWGWGTWADRWHYYNRDPQSLLDEFDEIDIQIFNIYGSYNFWEQVVNNADGKIRTWAVFWYATIFKHGGLCLNPSRAMTTNIGFDGSGTHDASIEHSLSHDLCFFYKKDVLPIELLENRKVVSAIIRFNNDCSNYDKVNQNKTNIDLKRLARASLSHHSHFSYLSGKRVAIFGTAELSLLTFQLLRRSGISICAFLVSSPGQSEYIEEIPVVRPHQWHEFNPQVIINCIEGNHESVITGMLSDALPGRNIISWRSL